MQIRDGTAEDVAQVIPMVEAIYRLHTDWDAAKFAPRENFAEGYARWLKGRSTDPRSIFLVAERDPGKLAGFLVATVEQEIPIYRTREYGFIHDLWVDADYRNEGTGRQLVMLAVERFKANGVTQVRLDTAGPNDAARRLFATCGFRVAAVQMLREG
jgi:ribosomal protein S18 acetylase RimI-like enzyme